VLNSHGVVNRYNAETGAFIGQNQPSGGPLTDVQVSGGVMIVRSPHVASRYNARTGAFLGQSQF
jgi:nitrite reductase/ring-hydroxylating ferredoxin subunit